MRLIISFTDNDLESEINKTLCYFEDSEAILAKLRILIYLKRQKNKKKLKKKKKEKIDGYSECR